jgi:N-acetylmuramoyl-L-alanine amidase
MEVVSKGIEMNSSAEHILDIAAAHLGEPYRLGARAPMLDVAWKGPWDCAEFVSWCVYRASGLLYGVQPESPMRADAYTGYWAAQAKRDHATIAVAEAMTIPGAVLLRAPQAGKIGHIVFSDGSGGTIEAHSSTRGVIRHTAAGRRWDWGVLVPGIEYFRTELTPAYRPPEPVLTVTRPLTRGPTVKLVQQALVYREFPVGPVDGIYGPQTEHAVSLFQAAHGLVADGEVGALTLEALGLVD